MAGKKEWVRTGAAQVGDQKMLTVKQVAAIMHRSIQTVRGWIEGGELRSYRAGESPHLISPSDLLDMVRRRSTAPDVVAGVEAAIKRELGDDALRFSGNSAILG